MRSLRENRSLLWFVALTWPVCLADMLAKGATLAFAPIFYLACFALSLAMLRES